MKNIIAKKWKRWVIVTVVVVIAVGIWWLVWFNSRTVIRVGSRRITADEIGARLTGVPEYYYGFLSTEGGMRQYVEGMVKEQILVQMARRRGLHRRQDVRERLRDLEEQLLIGTMIQELQKRNLGISDTEVEEFYQQHSQEFVRPQKVKVSHILVSTKKEAEETLKRLNEGEDFDSLVRKYSIDTQTSSSGGDVGYFSRGDMVPAFENAAFALKNIGDISDVVQTEFGYHIIKLTGRSSGESRSADEAREEVRTILIKNRFDELLTDWRKDLGVKIDYEKLAKMKLPVTLPQGTTVQQETD